MQSTKPKLRAIALSLSSMLILSGCATLTNFSGVMLGRNPQKAATIDPNKVACASFAPIYWSKDDTDQTIKQIKPHNATWVSLCRKEK